MQILTAYLWDLIQRLVVPSPGLPSWMQRLLSQSFGSVIKNEDIKIIIERKPIDVSYLDFLKEQIRLGARGPEWSEVLRMRLNALEPYVEKEVTTITFLYGEEGFVVQLIETPNALLLHCEAQ